MDTASKLSDDGPMKPVDHASSIRVYYSRSLEGSPILKGCAQLDTMDLEPLPADAAARSGSGPAVLLVSSSEEASGSCAAGFLLSSEARPTSLPEGWVCLPRETAFEDFFAILSNRLPHLTDSATLSSLQREFDLQALVLDQLTEVSLALSSEHNYRRLLDLILSRAMLLSGSDAGSLYVRIPEEEGDEGTVARMLFAASQNDSVAVPFKETELPVTKASLAGYVAATGETLVLEDAYELPPRTPYHFNRSFDEETGYRTKSMLVIPMTNQKGDITGVLQLINRKRNPSALLTSPQAVESEVIPYDAVSTRLMKTVGSLAAVAIDNNRLYENIERLFEGFVRASVTAIEQRDPTTSGHSLRVSILTVDLAEVVDRTTTGPLSVHAFTGEQLRELRYASLLHDFGKVGVREHVLVKAKKLYPFELERVLTRLETAHLYAERDILLRKIERLTKGGEAGPDEAAALDAELRRLLERMEGFREVILRADEPTVLPEGDFSALQAIAAASFTDRHGALHPLLQPEEVSVLSIRKGSLSEQERLEIESHVTHTYHFLKKIPWTRELKAVPEIAYAHHEKLNGRGYPRHVTSDDIPIQSKVMTVSDIFDALSASDRPYKRALPVEKALDILKFEVKDGLLDPLLVDLFIEAKCYEKTLHMRTTSM
jgi:HD-GYP domain-containing protein (c-di-GMP phosphodiesterase class II)